MQQHSIPIGDGHRRLADVIGEHLAKAHAMHEELDRIAKEQTGLTFNQCVLLGAIRDLGGGPKQGALAARLGRRPQTVTSAIDGMVKLGLLERFQVKDHDKRIVQVCETDRGRAIVLPLAIEPDAVLDVEWSADWKRSTSALIIGGAERAQLRLVEELTPRGGSGDEPEDVDEETGESNGGTSFRARIKVSSTSRGFSYEWSVEAIDTSDGNAVLRALTRSDELRDALSTRYAQSGKNDD